MNKKMLIILTIVVLIRLLLFIQLNIRDWNMILPELGFSSNPVPVWATDEQRREHGADFDSFWVLAIHNKGTNYILSYLEHYFDHFRGDFLFTNGDVLYLFDAFFIAIAFWAIVKKPKGWGLILIWLFAAPLIPALDFQPANPVKAFSMVVPLLVISTFGGIILIKHLFRLLNKVK